MTATTTTVPRFTVAKFLRDKRGNPIGLACATKGPSGDVTVGWSFVAKADRKQGNISKNRAWQIALARAEQGTNAVIPHVLHPVLNEIADRAKKYFKVNHVGVVGN
jgi:hypothetical protein